MVVITETKEIHKISNNYNKYPDDEWWNDDGEGWIEIAGKT